MNAPDDPEAAGRFRRVEALYHEILALPVRERASALRAACPEDPALAAEVQSLLDQAESVAGFLATPAVDMAAQHVPPKGPTLVGVRIGVFEVQGFLGAGGMGEVYRAQDTRLQRAVAIKILPRAFKDDPDRSARFEREARVLASLNHPHICTLYDVGQHEGVDYIVMELVDGETLAQRLKKGALSLDQTLRVAIEIADGLDKAHRQGVIHRDLKPANVMLTKSGAKLMDFGLARLLPARQRGEAVSQLATASAPLTSEGMLMGTVPYMAPEQLEGKPPDARSDLWALGCVMYEMATGRAAFDGKNQASLISAIMAASPPPPIGQVQPLTPQALERLVRVCLAREPDDRFQIAHDVMQELKWIAETPSGSTAMNVDRGQAPVRRRMGQVLLATAIVASLALGVLLGGRLLAPVPPRPPIVRSLLDIGPAEELSSGGYAAFHARGGSRTAITWTPDGGSLVFVGRRGDVQRLYVRALDGGEARVIEGTEGGQVPAVSPDSRWVAFWSDGAIKRVLLEGGPVTTLQQKATRTTGMAWGGDGRLFFAVIDGGIWSIQAERPPTPLTSLLDGELSHLNPHALPDGRALLHTVKRTMRTWGDEEVVAHLLATGERRVLLKDAADARYVQPGFLVFLRRGTLFGVRFDLPRLQVLGSPVPILDGVTQALAGGNTIDITGAGQFSVASTGTLAWLPALAASAAHPDANIVAIDRKGRFLPINAPPRTYGGPLSLSPDGGFLAVRVATLTEANLFVLDLGRGVFTRLPGEGESSHPRWTPDGKRVAFTWLIKGTHKLAWQPVDGTVPKEVLSDGNDSKGRSPGSQSGNVIRAREPPVPSSWSPNGRQLLFQQSGDIWVATLSDGKVTSSPLLETPDMEQWPEFSPDGRWISYGSNTSGRNEVYVQPYPGPGQRTQVSTDGGESPAWSHSGGEIFFQAFSQAERKRLMMSVTVALRPTLRLGKPQRLFAYTDDQLILRCVQVRCYDVSPDGQSFYATQPIPAPSVPPVTHVALVTNWVEELKAKVAAGQVK